jgi:hypothetical protein
LGSRLNAGEEHAPSLWNAGLASASVVGLSVP